MNRRSLAGRIPPSAPGALLLHCRVKEGSSHAAGGVRFDDVGHRLRSQGQHKASAEFRRIEVVDIQRQPVEVDPGGR